MHFDVSSLCKKAIFVLEISQIIFIKWLLIRSPTVDITLR